jgi:Tfp pilus assembly protein PilP
VAFDRLGIIAIVALAVAVSVTAQPSPAAQSPASQAPAPARQAPPAGRGTATPAEEAAAAQQLIEPAGFDYKPEGRRDPFVSLVRRAAGGRGGTSVVSRPTGLAGLGVGEITLRGTMRGREGFVALLQGSDQKTYIVRPGDKLFDGTIRTITQNDMVVVQQVNDPLSLEKQREVRKVLRQTEANQ